MIEERVLVLLRSLQHMISTAQLSSLAKTLEDIPGLLPSTHLLDGKQQQPPPARAFHTFC